jgi:hypothetical protein
MSIYLLEYILQPPRHILSCQQNYNLAAKCSIQHAAFIYMTSYLISTGKIKPDTWMIKIQKGQYLKVNKRGTRFVIQRKMEWQLQRQLAAQRRRQPFSSSSLSGSSSHTTSCSSTTPDPIVLYKIRNRMSPVAASTQPPTIS